MSVVRIGDPHLGRRFVNGVPLHRRGQRELEVDNTFYERVVNVPEGTKMVIIYGDIFDKFVVPPEVELFAASTLRKAANKNWDVSYVILRGNHDASRNVGLKSSFDVLEGLLADLTNVHLVKEPLIVGNFGFIPWDPFRSAAQQVELLAELGAEGADIGIELFDEVCGHWDIKSFGGDTHNLIPLAELSKITKRVSTGHIHQRSTFTHGDMTIEVVGSMLPYAHGEDNDPADPKYITMTMTEYDALIDKSVVKDKCVRLILQPGESAPADMDVLQLTTQRFTDVSDDGGDPEQVEMAEFDFRSIFFEEMTRENVSPSVANRIWDSYNSARSL